jgi:hypothetical protein
MRRDQDNAPAMPHTSGGGIHRIFRKAQTLRSRAAWWCQQMRRTVDEAAEPISRDKGANIVEQTAGDSNSLRESPNSTSLEESPANTTLSGDRCLKQANASPRLPADGADFKLSDASLNAPAPDEVPPSQFEDLKP